MIKKATWWQAFLRPEPITLFRCRTAFLGKEGNGRILSLILDTMKSYGVSAYDEKTGKGCVRHILIRYGEKTGEWMVCFVINGKKLPHAESFIEVLKDLPGMTSITVNINESRGNVILGEETYTLYGRVTLQIISERFLFRFLRSLSIR